MSEKNNRIPSELKEQAKEMLLSGKSAREISLVLGGISRTTIARMRNQLNADNPVKKKVVNRNVPPDFAEEWEQRVAPFREVAAARMPKDEVISRLMEIKQSCADRDALAIEKAISVLKGEN